MKKVLLVALILMFSVVGIAQIESPVSWSYAAKKTSPTDAILYIKAKIGFGWHIYGQDIPKGESISTLFKFYPNTTYKLVGKTDQPGPVTKFEKALDLTVTYFENSVLFKQKLKLTQSAPTILRGEVSFMACNNVRCLPSETLKFSIPIK